MENLSKIRGKIEEIKPLEDIIAKLDERSLNAKNEIERHLQKNCDANRIQTKSWLSFIKKIRKYEEELEKERQEEIEARSSFQKAVSELAGVKEEKRELELMLSELRHLAQEYEKELENRRNNFQHILSEVEGQQYRQYEDEIDDLVSQAKKIDEVTKAVACVISTTWFAIDSLDSATGLSVLDAFLGGFLIDAAKYSHIDKAEGYLYSLPKQIHDLREQLSSLKGLSWPELTLECTPTSTGASWIFDVLFDSTLADIHVLSKIHDNKEQLDLLMEALGKTKAQLNNKVREINLCIEGIRRKQEDLLISQ
ncbi:MAG: hypothetical protein FWG42_08835 [Clostridiales bacterium]|nr:hypothetical protein [Clostridiales bacterium]